MLVSACVKYVQHDTRTSKALTVTQPSSIYAASWMKKIYIYATYKEPTPARTAYKSWVHRSNLQPTGDAWKFARWRTLHQSTLRWEGLHWIMSASVACLHISSYFLLCLSPLQLVSTWLSLGIKLQKSKWIQEAIFGLQVRIFLVIHCRQIGLINDFGFHLIFVSIFTHNRFLLFLTVLSLNDLFLLQFSLIFK